MSIALQPVEGHCLVEAEVRRRPNGVRVLRLLRELFFIDGKLASSLRQSGDFPLATFALVAAVVLPSLALAILPSAQSAPAPALTQSAVVDDKAEVQALLARQAQAYTRWLHEAHARVAAQGRVAPDVETF
jgi:hypothetical protein